MPDQGKPLLSRASKSYALGKVANEPSEALSELGVRKTSTQVHWLALLGFPKRFPLALRITLALAGRRRDLV